MFLWKQELDSGFRRNDDKLRADPGAKRRLRRRRGANGEAGPEALKAERGLSGPALQGVY